MERFDLLVLGAGSAGYAAARTAGSQGATVGLIDKGPLGGLCILRGCMPSKALLRSSEVIELIRHAGELGLNVAEPTIDWDVLQKRRAALVKEFADYRIEQIHRAPNTTLFMGEATLVDAHTVQVGDRLLYGESILITTGSRPFIPPVPGLAEAGYLISDQALELPERPRSMIVVGAGAIGLELGQFYQRMGCQVTVVQRSGHVLSDEDADVAEALTQALAGDGMRILTDASVRAARLVGGERELVVQVGPDELTIRAEQVLIATGRVANIEPLGLEESGVRVINGWPVVDAYMRTSVPNIYAAGDVTGKKLLVHLAIQQAEWAAANAVGKGAQQADYRLIPNAVFTDPGVAQVGLTEKQARAEGRSVLVGRYDFADHGKAMCLGTPAMKGFVKLIGDAGTGELVGGAIVGPEAADLIHEIVVALHYRATAAEFMMIPHVHPTLAEIWTYPAEEIEAQRQSLLKA